MKLEDLLQTLSDCDGPTRFPLRRTGEDLDYRLTGLDAFVAPNLSTRPDVSTDSSGATVTIISAAGAVGKTTLANELAFRKKTLLWDLAQSRAVGQSSLSGTLLSVFGTAQIAGIDSSLRSGKLFLVIDALD